VPAGHHEHRQVEELAGADLVARGEDELDLQELRIRLHRLVAVPKDRQALLVGPAESA